MKVFFFIIGFGAFFIGAVGALFVSQYASRLTLMDIPNDRSSHSFPTPKGGGVGILIAFVLFSFLSNLSMFIIVAVTVMALVSFWGDRQELAPKFRLIVQFLCAILAMIGIGFGSGLEFSRYWLLLFPPVTLIFIVGTANFYNFMDGINGIAGITGVIAFACLSGWAFTTNRLDIAVSSFALSAACAGFLPFNFPNARVFMGDTGSVLLGFCFALFTVAISRSVTDFFVISTLLYPFYADELCTMIQRFIDNNSLFQAHRKHLYQVMVNELGIEHWKVSIGYGALQILAFGLILFLSKYGMIYILIGFIGLAGIWFIVDLKVKLRAWRK